MSLNKEKIIEIALLRFSRFGFSKTTMNEIAEDLNITKGNLYYYYADKAKLIADVILYIGNEMIQGQKEIIENSKEDFLGTLFEILEHRSKVIKKYYMLHLSENLDWIKDLELDEIIEDMKTRDCSELKNLFENAESLGNVKFSNIDEAAELYIDIMKGLALKENISNIINCLPDYDKIDLILESQKRATQFIFEDKIIHK